MKAVTPEEAWEIAQGGTAPPAEPTDDESFLDYCYRRIVETAANMNEPDMRWRTTVLVKKIRFAPSHLEVFKSLRDAGYRVLYMRDHAGYSVAVIQFWRGAKYEIRG